jgi:hypothetical protein
MTRMVCLPAGCLPLFAGLLLIVTAAGAEGGGSLGLDDVLDAVKADPKLVAEIQDEVKKSGLKTDGIVCTGFRHDNRWDELSGARAGAIRM